MAGGQISQRYGNGKSVATPPPTITVYVATCQNIPTESTTNGTATPPSFKPIKFPTNVLPTTKVETIQCFLLTQWAITKNPLAGIPASEQFYTFKGQILRLDGTLDAYYIMNNDTIYIRFASMGKVCDPWAMSTSELRIELKARNAYQTNLHPEQLMLLLQEQLMKESRMQRLQQATKREETAKVQSITKELALFQSAMKREWTGIKALTARRSSSGGGISQFTRPASLKWPHPPSPKRTVFLSIAELERTYQFVPRDVLEPAIFIFDTERKWVFDSHNVLQKQHFDYKYMSFEKDFLEMLTLKEEAGMVFWFRPHKNYEKMSTFFSSHNDPVTKKKYNPLILKPSKWLTLCGINGWEGKMRNDGRRRDVAKMPQFTKSIVRITTNLASQSFDYLAVQEILYQSNPTLLFAPLK